MREEFIKYSEGKVLGKIEILSNGDNVAYDLNDIVLGKYIKKDNNTVDNNNHIMFTGDVVKIFILFK